MDKTYDKQVSIAVKNNPYKFIDVLNDAADRNPNDAPLLHEAACVIAYLLDGREKL